MLSCNGKNTVILFSCGVKRHHCVSLRKQFSISIDNNNTKEEFGSFVYAH